MGGGTTSPAVALAQPLAPSASTSDSGTRRESSLLRGEKRDGGGWGNGDNGLHSCSLTAEGLKVL